MTTTTIFGAHTIELASGRGLDLSAPMPGAITLPDVARGLSHTCRFAGQTARFYSVAEHAVLVSRRLEQLDAPVETQMEGLHHDDAEAFLGDVTRPLKLLLPEYSTLEERVLRVIRLTLDLPDPDREARDLVKLADDWALAAEAFHLLPSKGAGWFCDGLYDPEHPGPAENGVGLGARDAEHDWLRRHRDLQRRLAR